MSTTCSFPECTQMAEYYCSCGDLLCDSHLGSHIKVNNGHSLMNLWDELSPCEVENLKNSVQLLDEFLYTRCKEIDYKIQSIENSIQKRIDSSRAFHSLQLEYLDSSKSQINNFIESLTNTGVIKTNSLGSFNNFPNLRLFHGNKIEKKWFFDYINAKITNSIPELHKRTAFIWEESMRIIGEEETEFHISCNELGMYPSSSAMELIDGSILVVSCEISFKILPDTYEQVRISNINYGRSYHSLGYIGEFPAVIGGYQHDNVGNVEILEDTDWKEISMLKVPRHGASVAKHGMFTYVFGGYIGADFDSVIDAIERYEYDDWRLLECKLPLPMAHCGVVSHLNGLLVLGGALATEMCCDNVYYWDIGSTWETLMPLAQPYKFEVNMWIKRETTIKSYDSTGELVTYPIDLISNH